MLEKIKFNRDNIGDYHATIENLEIEISESYIDYWTCKIIENSKVIFSIKYQENKKTCVKRIIDFINGYNPEKNQLEKISLKNQEKNELLNKLEDRYLFNKLFDIATNDNSIFIGSFLLISNNRIKSKIVYLTCKSEDGKIQALKFRIKDFKKLLPDFKIQEIFHAPELYKNEIKNLKFTEIKRTCKND